MLNDKYIFQISIHNLKTFYPIMKIEIFVIRIVHNNDNIKIKTNYFRYQKPCIPLFRLKNNGI